MSPSEDTTTKALMAALASIEIEVKQPAIDNAPPAASANGHAIATPVTSQTNESEPVKQVLVPVMSDHPSQDKPSFDPEMSLLADRLARLDINEDDDGQIVPSSSASSTGSEDPGSQESPKPNAQLDGSEEDQDLSEVTDPTSASTPEEDAAGAFPLDESSDEPDEPTTGSIAPPPSPTGSTHSSSSSVDPEDFFKIQPSELGGLGAFAVRELHRGETILVERPLLWTTHFQLMRDYHNLSDAAKQAYLSLHGADDGDRFSRVERIKQLNSFAVPGGLAIFALASRFNHACPPARNVEYAFGGERGEMRFTVCRDVVPAGAELRISYSGEPVDLYSTYGFRCACGGCTPLTDEDLRVMRGLEYGAGGW